MTAPAAAPSLHPLDQYTKNCVTISFFYMRPPSISSLLHTMAASWAAGCYYLPRSFIESIIFCFLFCIICFMFIMYYNYIVRDLHLCNVSLFNQNAEIKQRNNRASHSGICIVMIGIIALFEAYLTSLFHLFLSLNYSLLLVIKLHHY